MENKLTKLAPATKPKALEIMAAKLSVDPMKLLDTLKSTVFKGASNEELLALVVVANQYDLDPLLKQVYAFPAKGGGIVPIISVDGWNKILLRQDNFDGIEFDFQDTEDGKVYSCTATVHIKGRSHPVKVTEFLDECRRNTDPWNNMPRRMLRNRTLCQAARMAFGVSGIYDPDEAVDIVSTVMPTEPLKAIKPPPPESGTQPTHPPTATARTPQQDLEAVIIEGGFGFDEFRQWADAAGQLENASSLASFDELKKSDAERFLRAKEGLLKGLKGAAL